MGFSLLAPLFLIGLVAVAVPIWVHLRARDRRDALRFPSLKFLTRLPYRQVKRQRLQHRFLFALRALALILLVLAFTRPFFDGAAAVAAGGSGHEIVIALDRSYSMAHAGAWERAVAAVSDAVSGAPPDSRLSLASFAEEAAVEVAPSTDRQAVLDALERLAPGSGTTRFAPALRLADEILRTSPLAEHRVVLVSDLQSIGWDRSADADPAVLSPGTELTAIDASASGTTAPNIGVSGASVRQTSGDAGAEMTVTARLVHDAKTSVEGVPVTVTVETVTGETGGRAEAAVDLPPSGSTEVRLGPIDLPPGLARVTVRAGDDPLPADNIFHLTVEPRPRLPVLLIEAPDARPEASLYLRQALTVPPAGPEGDTGSTPAATFDLRLRSVAEASPKNVADAAVVVIHDSPFPAGATGRALADRVAGGGGLWVILGSRSQPPGGDLETLLPGGWRDSVDRLEERGVGLTGIDYRHPVFRIFAGPGDGNLAAPRFYRYRPIALDDAAGGAAVARTADGAVALAERRAGKGRVLLWGSTFDNRWSDLPVQAVFLPFVHQVCRYLAGERTHEPWHQVGQALDLRALAARTDVESAATGLAGTAVVETPSGEQREISLESEAVVSLTEAGFYRVTLPGREQTTLSVAANVNPAESDLTRLDPQAFVAASTAPGDIATASLSREQLARRQGVWWFLLMAVLLLLGAESLGSNGAHHRISWRR